MEIMLKIKCCFNVIISILFFSITICNLLIESPSYFILYLYSHYYLLTSLDAWVTPQNNSFRAAGFLKLVPVRYDLLLNLNNIVDITTCNKTSIVVEGFHLMNYLKARPIKSTLLSSSPRYAFQLCLFEYSLTWLFVILTN